MTIQKTEALLGNARLKPLPDLKALPDEALLTDAQTAVLSGFSVAAFKKWRREGGLRGPATIYVENRPRTTVRAYREWIAGAQRAAS